MISLSIFQPIRRWAESDARELQRKRNLEELKEEVRLLFHQKRG